MKPVTISNARGHELLIKMPQSSPCSCSEDGQHTLPGLRQSFVVGTVEAPVGKVPRISTRLTVADWWGSFKARWKIGRMNYKVQPGLYALGSPDAGSPVLVTANYKMSFDSLRRELYGRNSWVLVLDTRGINVWCAAGKGTFGTEELLKQVESCRLSDVVDHRTLVVPQLGAAGVAAHQVREGSGFKVVYGPVRAGDLPAFLDSGLKATAQMRNKTFTVSERLILIPVELVSAVTIALIALPGFFLLSGLIGHGPFRTAMLTHGVLAAWGILCIVLAGAVLTPVLLPWLPGRAFSLKGFTSGLMVSAVLVGFTLPAVTMPARRLELLAWVMMILAGAAWLGMNFTGASTYTSRSGVKREMRNAIPLEITAVFAGMGLWVAAVLLA